MPAAQRELVNTLPKPASPSSWYCWKGAPGDQRYRALASGILMAYYPGNEGGKRHRRGTDGRLQSQRKIAFIPTPAHGLAVCLRPPSPEERDINWGSMPLTHNLNSGSAYRIPPLLMIQLEMSPRRWSRR